MRLRSAKVFSRWTQPATGTWARLHILSELILTPGRTSFYFLNQPGQADIQTDLFFDYQNNLKAYPIWQKWLRDHQPPMLVLWGRYDPSFIVAGAEGYRKDVAGAEVHILDAGHFALDEQAGEVIRLTGAFMEKLRGQQSSD